MTISRIAFFLIIVAGGAGAGVYTIAARNARTEAHKHAAQLALERGDFVQADEQLALYLKARPQDAEAHLSAAQSSRRAIFPILFEDDDSPESRNAEADAVYARAEQFLVEYQRLGGDTDRIQLELDLLHTQRGDLTGEGRLRNLVQNNHPESLLILEALVKGYLVNYRMPEAEHCLDQGFKHQETVQALLCRGWMTERGHQYTRALNTYRRALELDPNNFEAELHLAELLVTTSQPAEALEHYRRLYERKPEKPALVLGLAQSHRGLGQRDEARLLLDRLLAEHPDYPKALVERANLELQDKQPGAAEIWVRKALEKMPWDRPATYLLYLCLEQGGKKEEASEWSARLNDIDADLKQIDEVTRRVAVHPHDPAWRYEAGAILLCHGLDKDGLHWLRSALQENPGHAPTLNMLADYDKVGRSLEKKQFFQNTHAALADYYEQSQDPKERARSKRHRQLARASH